MDQWNKEFTFLQRKGNYWNLYRTYLNNIQAGATFEKSCFVLTHFYNSVYPFRAYWELLLAGRCFLYKSAFSLAKCYGNDES